MCVDVFVVYGEFRERFRIGAQEEVVDFVAQFAREAEEGRGLLLVYLVGWLWIWGGGLWR